MLTPAWNMRARDDIEEHKRPSGSVSDADLKLKADLEVLKVEEDVVPVLKSGRPQAPSQDRSATVLFARLTNVLAECGLETNGITPIPPEQRTDKRLYQMFLLWFSANANIFAMTTGTVGPAFYGLGIRDSLLVIVFVNVVTSVFPAYFAVFGPKLGTRAMVQARFSWGFYGAIIPSVLNILSCQGYLILNTIIGGQTLGSISSHLNATLGIVIIGLTTLAVVVSGYRVLHWYESVVWIPNVIALIVMLAASGKHVVAAPLSGTTPVTPASIVTFGATLTAATVGYSPMMADYGVYHDCNASTMRIFLYTYFGLMLSSMPAQLIGAAFAATAVYVPSWQAGLGNGNNIGGLIAAVLQPTGGFGKFLLIPLSLTAPSQCAPAMYTACTSLMTVSEVFQRIPRYVVAAISTAILIPVAIIGSTRFYSAFADVLSFIGYWVAPFCAVVLVEHFIFRQNIWSSYVVLDAWNQPRHPNLPRGYAALFTFIAAVGFIVLCMDQAWWTGPIARMGTGDVGMLLGFPFSVIVHVCARRAERSWLSGRMS